MNAYLREITGEDYTAKDFRTWAGTVLAAIALRAFEAFDSEAGAKRNVRTAIEDVAQRLGNTPTICRKCYIHPEVLDCYLEGALLDQMRGAVENELTEDPGHLRAEEAAVLGLLQSRLARVRKDIKDKANKRRKTGGNETGGRQSRRSAAEAA